MQKNHWSNSEELNGLQSQVNEVQKSLIEDFFQPLECAETLDSWERVFEYAAFHSHGVVVSKEFINDLEIYYSLLKKIRRLADLDQAFDEMTE